MTVLGDGASPLRDAVANALRGSAPEGDARPAVTMHRHLAAGRAADRAVARPLSSPWPTAGSALIARARRSLAWGDTIDIGWVRTETQGAFQ
jgi:hypothetical protein